MLLVFLATLSVSSASIPFSKNFPLKTCKVVSVYDGDTITVEGYLLDVKETSPLYSFKIRLSGIDTPELRTRNCNEKIVGYVVKDVVKQKVLGETIELQDNLELDKYGRILSTITVDGLEVNQWLIDEHFALGYGGGTKAKKFDWKAYMIGDSDEREEMFNDMERKLLDERKLTSCEYETASFLQQQISTIRENFGGIEAFTVVLAFFMIGVGMCLANILRGTKATMEYAEVAEEI